MPQELSVVKLGKGLEPAVFTMSGYFEDFQDLQLVLVVSSSVSVSHVCHQTLELLSALGENLEREGGERNRKEEGEERERGEKVGVREGRE